MGDSWDEGSANVRALSVVASITDCETYREPKRTNPASADEADELAPIVGHISSRRVTGWPQSPCYKAYFGHAGNWQTFYQQ